MSACVCREDAIVVPFVPRRADPRSLNVSERIEALRWADAAWAYGVRDLRIHEPERGDDPAVGPFILIYEGEDIWAAWGIVVRPGSFEVWRPSSGRTIGWYRTLGDALRVIRDVGLRHEPVGAATPGARPDRTNIRIAAVAR